MRMMASGPSLSFRPEPKLPVLDELSYTPARLHARPFLCAISFDPQNEKKMRTEQNTIPLLYRLPLAKQTENKKIQ
jgi:hypothetical protein